MAVRPVRAYLADMLDSVRDIEDFTREGQAAFFADRKTSAAVIRMYEVIGEVAKRLPDELLETRPEVDWKAVKKFRDVLIHQYHSVDLALVWEAVTKLPTLRAAIEAMIAALDAPPPDSPSE
jgi:uncharacterized protein with HEPN domain